MNEPKSYLLLNLGDKNEMEHLEICSRCLCVSLLICSPTHECEKVQSVK
jgi:hypothetical protein